MTPSQGTDMLFSHPPKSVNSGILLMYTAKVNTKIDKPDMELKSPLSLNGHIPYPKGRAAAWPSARHFAPTLSKP